jgi:hypothetical protein
MPRTTAQQVKKRDATTTSRTVFRHIQEMHAEGSNFFNARTINNYNGEEIPLLVHFRLIS